MPGGKFHVSDPIVLQQTLLLEGFAWVVYSSDVEIETVKLAVNKGGVKIYFCYLEIIKINIKNVTLYEN